MELENNEIIEVNEGNSHIASNQSFSRSHSRTHSELIRDASPTKKKDTMKLLQSNFNKFMQDLRSNLAKKRYKKVLEEIHTKEGLFLSLNDYWKVNELKLQIMVKIIHRKLIKIDKNISAVGSPNIWLNKSIDTWFGKFDMVVDSWLNSITLNEESQIQIESLVQLILEQLYLKALQSRIDNKFHETAAFLAFGEKIIKVFIEYSRNPKTINISAKINLFISSLMIGDYDYETAKLYQINCLKLSFRELFLRTDVIDGLNYEKLSNSQQHTFNKIFVNIIIAFYQRGVCEESLGKIVKAIEAYKQSRWFSMKFIKSEIPELAQFIVDVEKRAFSYHHLIKSMQQRDEELKKKLLSNEKEKIVNDLILEREAMLSSIAEGNYIDLKKFEKTKQLVESLKFPEFEYENKSGTKPKTTKEYILSTIKLIDNLLSDDFKKILKDVKNLEINKMDKEVQEKLQKKINELRVEKFFKNKRRNDIIDSEGLKIIALFNTPVPQCKRSGSMENNIMRSDTLKSFYQTSPKLQVKNQEDSTFLARNNSTSTIFSLNNQLSPNKRSSDHNTNKVSSKIINKTTFSFLPHKESKIRAPSARIPYCSYNPNKVEKIAYDECFFSKSFRNKITYLEKLNNKEILFQKQLLYLKRHEKLDVQRANPRKVKEDVKNFFRRSMSAKINQPQTKFAESQGEKVKLIKDAIYSKKDLTKTLLENSVIMSLSTNQLEKFKNLVGHDKPKVHLRDEFNSKKTELAKSLSEVNLVNKNNKDVVKNINKEIEQLDKEYSYYGDMLKCSSRNNFQHNKRYTHSNSRSPESISKKASFVVKNMDNFVKKEGIITLKFSSRPESGKE